MLGDQEAPRSCDSPSSDDISAYCHRGLEALDTLAQELSARRNAGMGRDAALETASFIPCGANHSADQSREETDIGIHYRHPSAVASGLYTDSSIGATPSPPRRIPVAPDAPQAAMTDATPRIVTDTTKPLPVYHTSGAPLTRPKASAAQLWYYPGSPAPAATTAATTSCPPAPAQHTTAPIATATRHPQPSPSRPLRDFYASRAAPATGSHTTTQSSSGHSTSGPCHHDVLALDAAAHVKTRSGPAAVVPRTANTTTAPTATKTDAPHYYHYNDGQHTFEVLASSSASSEDVVGAAVNTAAPHGRPRTDKGSAATAEAQARTRSAPAPTRATTTQHSTSSASTREGRARTSGQQTRSRSASDPPLHPKRRAYQRSRSSSNDEDEKVALRTGDARHTQTQKPPPVIAKTDLTGASIAKVVMAKPAWSAHAKAPQETLCTATATTGAKQTAAAAAMVSREETGAQQAPISYPRMRQPAQTEPHRDAAVAARARSEPHAAAPSTRAAAPNTGGGGGGRPLAVSPPLTRPCPPPSAQTRPALPVPLGPPAWVTFPRHTISTGGGAAVRGPITAYPLTAMPNYYSQFHTAQGKPAPAVAPARLRPLEAPSLAPPPPMPAARQQQPVRRAAAAAHGTRTPANATQGHRQQSPMTEMRLSYSEVYQPLRLLGGGSPGAGLRASLETVHVPVDPLERLDSARILRRPVSQACSSAAASRPRPCGTEKEEETAIGRTAFYSPWTASPSAIGPAADRSAAPSGLSTLARMMASEPRHDTQGHRESAPLLEANAAAPRPAPLVPRAGRHLAPIAPAAMSTQRQQPNEAPVHRALDFDGRLTAAGSPVTRPAQRTPTPPLSRPGASPPPMKPGVAAFAAAAPSVAAVVRDASVVTKVSGGGVVAEHMPAALPTSPGGASSRSHGSGAAVIPLSARALGTMTPSSGSSGRQAVHPFTSSPSVPAMAGQPVGALTTASVGPSSATTSSRRSTALTKEEEMTQMSPVARPPPQASPAGLDVSPRRARQAANAYTNYYGAFHNARLRPAPVVAGAAANDTAAMDSPPPSRPQAAHDVFPNSNSKQPLPPADAVREVSPRQVLDPPPLTYTTGTIAADLPLPHPRPRLTIPNDIALPEATVPPRQAEGTRSDPVHSLATKRRARDVSEPPPVSSRDTLGKRIKYKLFKRRNWQMKETTKATAARGGRSYKPMRRSRSSSDDRHEDNAWETLPPPPAETAAIQPRVTAARTLFPSEQMNVPFGMEMVAGRRAAPLQSTTLTPVKTQRRNRLLAWMR